MNVQRVVPKPRPVEVLIARKWTPGANLPRVNEKGWIKAQGLEMSTEGCWVLYREDDTLYGLASDIALKQDYLQESEADMDNDAVVINEEKRGRGRPKSTWEFDFGQFSPKWEGDTLRLSTKAGDGRPIVVKLTKQDLEGLRPVEDLEVVELDESA